MISDGYGQISIYDLNGRKVLDVIDNYIEFGAHSITIGSKGLSSGMYFYNLQVRDSGNNPIFNKTKKMALVKWNIAQTHKTMNSITPLNSFINFMSCFISLELK